MGAPSSTADVPSSTADVPAGRGRMSGRPDSVRWWCSAVCACVWGGFAAVTAAIVLQHGAQRLGTTHRRHGDEERRLVTFVWGSPPHENCTLLTLTPLPTPLSAGTLGGFVFDRGRICIPNEVSTVHESRVSAAHKTSRRLSGFKMKNGLTASEVRAGGSQRHAKSRPDELIRCISTDLVDR